MSKLYFAYGSNCNIQQMIQRCPTATVVGSAVLPQWRLRLSKFCDIVPDASARVHGAVWDITGADEKLLDVYEGYPKQYTKVKVSVRLGSGETVEAMTYVMVGGDLEFPAEEYTATVIKGYDDHGIPHEQYVDAAVEVARSMVQES